MTEENKAVVRRVVEDLFDTGDPAIVDEAFAADYVDHTPPTPACAARRTSSGPSRTGGLPSPTPAAGSRISWPRGRRSPPAGRVPTGQTGLLLTLLLLSGFFINLNFGSIYAYLRKRYPKEVVGSAACCRAVSGRWGPLWPRSSPGTGGSRRRREPELRQGVRILRGGCRRGGGLLVVAEGGAGQDLRGTGRGAQAPPRRGHVAEGPEHREWRALL